MAIPLQHVLPHDLLAHVLGFLDAITLLSVSTASRSLCAAAADERVWRELLWRNHGAVLASVLFQGEVPRPRLGRSWKQHYFEFVCSWKNLAQERTWRILLKIHSSAAGDGSRGSYGVYDATEYALLHPGLDLIVQDAAEDEDSTEAFAAASHSPRACSILRTLAVPGLESLACDGEECLQLAVLRARVRRRRHLACALRWGLPAVCSIVGLRVLMPFAAQEDGPLLTLAALASAHARLVPMPSAPWLVASFAIILSLYEWSCEGVGCLALLVLLIALRSGAVGQLLSFFLDLFAAPAALGVLIFVPLTISLSKQRVRKLREWQPKPEARAGGH